MHHCMMLLVGIPVFSAYFLSCKSGENFFQEQKKLEKEGNELGLRVEVGRLFYWMHFAK